MSVRVLTHIGGEVVDTIAREVPGVEVIAIPGDGELGPQVQGDVLFTSGWGTSNMRQALERGVQWIHTMGTGVERFPFDLLSDQVLTCARGASAVPISEWVLACMLAFEKQLPERWLSAPPERWNLAQLGTLYGKTVGIVGLGGIGLAVAHRALAFDMEVVACRRTDALSPIPSVRLVKSVDELLPQSDHLVVAAPATPATHHVIDARAFSLVKPGVHIVNIARGSLVDQDALREALDAEIVAMASLDAVDPEPLPEDHWMYSHPRVRLSPHISWSPSAVDESVRIFIGNLRRYLAGEPLEGVVDLSEGY